MQDSTLTGPLPQLSQDELRQTVSFLKDMLGDYQRRLDQALQANASLEAQVSTLLHDRNNLKFKLHLYQMQENYAQN